MFYNFNPIYHISPMIIGMLVGHLILHRKPSAKSSRNIIVAGIICLLCFLYTFVYMEKIDYLSPKLSNFEILSMVSLGRVMICGLFIWIIYACTSGHISKLDLPDRPILSNYLFSHCKPIHVFDRVPSAVPTVVWLFHHQHHRHLLPVVFDPTNHHTVRADDGKCGLEYRPAD